MIQPCKPPEGYGFTGFTYGNSSRPPVCMCVVCMYHISTHIDL